MRKIISKLSLRFLKVLFFFTPAIALAAPLDNPNAVFSTIDRIVGFMLQILIVGSVFVVMYAGYLYMTAGDNEDQIGQATKVITYAVIALVIGLLAYSFKTIIINVFNQNY